MKNKANKKNKWDLITLKSVIAEETINKKTTLIMQLIFANKDICKEFISKTHKQLMHLDIKETTQSNGAEDLNGPFPTENREMAMKHMRRCSASVSIRAVNQKYNGASPHTGQKGHHRKSTTINAGEQMEGKNPPSCWWE